MMNRQNLFRAIIKFKTRAGRGQALLSHINILFVFLGIAYLEKLKNAPQLAVFVFVGYAVACYCLGFLDQKYGFWLAEQLYNSYELDPVNQSIIYKIDALRREIQEKDV